MTEEEIMLFKISDKEFYNSDFECLVCHEILEGYINACLHVFYEHHSILYSDDVEGEPYLLLKKILEKNKK
jgi:hypothetical protein